MLKALIPKSTWTLTQKGKLSIVYSQRKDEREYLRYIRFLKAKGYFTDNIEIVELEGLQGVTGLKAIRAEILYKKDKKSELTYTYDDLMEELRSWFKKESCPVQKTERQCQMQVRIWSCPT